MNDVRKAANGTTVECVVFQDQLASLFESGEDLNEQEHFKSCPICSALVRDLEYIRDAAKLLLPLHDPSPAVWQKIESAIEKEESSSAK